jgi:hypothetical protein
MEEKSFLVVLEYRLRALLSAQTVITFFVYSVVLHFQVYRWGDDAYGVKSCSA